MSTAASKTTILCVDDEETGLYFRRLVLEQHGYRVLTAGSSQRALEIFLQHDIDLVITDRQLGRDVGETLAAEMKRLRPNIPVLLLSGAGDQSASVRTDRMDKTSSPVEFLNRVKQLLETRPRVGPQSIQPDPSGDPLLPADGEMD